MNHIVVNVIKYELGLLFIVFVFDQKILFDKFKLLFHTYMS